MKKNVSLLLLFLFAITSFSQKKARMPQSSSKETFIEPICPKKDKFGS